MEAETGEILCILHPSSRAAHEAVENLALYHPDQVVRLDLPPDPYSQNLKPGYKGHCFDIALRSYPGLRNPQTSFTFGRHRLKCDVPIGGSGSSRRISNQHFRIYQESATVMLEDFSTNGTWVDECKIGGRDLNGEPDHQNGNKRRLVTGSVISLAPGLELLKFVVRIPDSPRKGVCQRAGQLPPFRNSLGRRAQADRPGIPRSVPASETKSRVDEGKKQRVWVTVAEGEDWCVEALSGSRGWKVRVEEGGEVAAVRGSEKCDSLKVRRRDHE